ncbi:hypothetical protein ACNQGP_09340 [Flavobacterium sp. GT2N3]|uniref:hypothetical protein n=1 Tax=unclassified Flavobacterium TaxID=196869 RepID=UPI003AAC49BA
MSSTWKRQKLKLLQEKFKVKVLEKVEKSPFYPSVLFVKHAIYTARRFFTSVVCLIDLLPVENAIPCKN